MTKRWCAISRSVLEKFGYRVTTAENASRSYLFTGSPDEFAVVLLDLTMPVMTAKKRSAPVALRPDAKC